MFPSTFLSWVKRKRYVTTLSNPFDALQFKFKEIAVAVKNIHFTYTLSICRAIKVKEIYGKIFFMEISNTRTAIRKRTHKKAVIVLKV